MPTPQLQISFGATPEGCRDAIVQLTQLENALASSQMPTPAPAPAQQSSNATAQPKRAAPTTNPAVELYRSMADEKDSRSPRFLKALTDQGQSLEDIAPHTRMPGESSDPSLSSMRAIFRNVRRTENWMIDHGLLTEPVVRVDDSRYDVEGFCRYSLRPDDYQALSQI